ncbi:centriole, cilia and spindle-associated protein-like isoform X2 [Anguilla rostrata]
MVTKKIRTEYMKKFKDPKWETYSKCYEDSLKYRLTRRLLEQAHKPWFWEGWDSGSESSGRSTPRNRNKVEPLNLPVLKSPTPHENETCEPLEQKSVLKDSSEPNGTCLEIAEPPAETDISHPLLHTDAIVEGDSTEEDQRHGEEKEHTGRPRGARSEPDCSGHAPSNSHLRRKPARAKSQPPREPVEKQAEKENRHPFVLYGWAEKQAETAVKKTHNVCSSASAKEIYLSALRAKTRREAEKRGRALDRRRARSADLEKMHKAKLDPVDDPWMTEYMRCFSARSRA